MHTKGPWRVSPGESMGNKYGSVVADCPEGCARCKKADVDGYGGHLIAESIAVSDRPLIAAAPDLHDRMRDVIDAAANFINAPTGGNERQLNATIERGMELVEMLR